MEETVRDGGGSGRYGGGSVPIGPTTQGAGLKRPALLRPISSGPQPPGPSNSGPGMLKGARPAIFPAPPHAAAGGVAPARAPVVCRETLDMSEVQIGEWREGLLVESETQSKMS